MNNNKLIIKNTEIRTKQKNLTILQHLIKFKKHRRKCKDYLNEINTILTKKMTLDNINNEDMYSITIYSVKLKLHLLHMTYHFDKLQIG